MPATDPEAERTRRAARYPLESLGVQIAIAAGLAGVVVLTFGPCSRATGAPGEGGQAGPDSLAATALEAVLYSLVPAELGVDAWEPGEYAEYEWRDASKAPALIGEDPRRVRVEVLRRLAADDARASVYGMPYGDLHWLRLRSVQVFRARPLDVYRLVAPRSLEISAATPAFALHDGYFPLLGSAVAREGPSRFALVEAGEEIVATALGEILCRKFEVRGPEAGPAGRAPLLAEVWTSAEAPPLAVVRAKTARESMLLVERGRAQPTPPPDAIAPLVDGRSILSEACDSCHGSTCREILDVPR